MGTEGRTAVAKGWGRGAWGVGVDSVPVWEADKVLWEEHKGGDDSPTTV